MIALHFGYKMFAAESIDGLTIEQYYVLIGLYNKKAKEENQAGKTNKYTTSIISVNE